MNQPAFDAIRTYRYVYVQHANGERELYDLERDPYQLTSLHNDPAYADVQAELALRLGLLSVCAGRSCRSRPAARLAVRSCRARVSGSGVESVTFRSARRLRLDRRGPSARRWRRSLRARIQTSDGRIVTLDRALPTAAAERRDRPEHPPRVVVLETPLRVERAHGSPRSGPTRGSAAASVAADW